MNFLRRIALTWRMARAIPSLEFWQGALPKLEALKWSIPQRLESLDAFIPKLDALERILGRLDDAGVRIPPIDVLTRLNQRLEALDGVVSKIETLSFPAIEPKPKNPVIPAKTPPPDMTQKHEWDRLKMLARFCQLEGQAKAIEDEWRQIQQDENDAFFAWQSIRKSDAELLYLYKKGIADGIKWCVNRFC